MRSVPYDASRRSLYTPGLADDFFQLGDYGRDAALCAELSRLAYVKEEQRLVAYLARADMELVETVGYEGSGTQAFIAARGSSDLAVVAFRGTESDDLKDLGFDIDAVPVAWSDPSGRPLGRVHRGFMTAAADRGAFGKVKERLDTLHSGLRILVTGHSLGGALATLLATWSPRPDLYTFGSPRVGDEALAAAVRSGGAFRFAQCLDVVTRLPPDRALGYGHVGRHVYIDRNGALIEDPSDELVSADRFRARLSYTGYLRFWGNVATRGLADHAPINYVSAVLGIRG